MSETYCIYEKTKLGIHIYFCGTRKECRLTQMQREELNDCKIKKFTLLVDDIFELRRMI